VVFTGGPALKGDIEKLAADKGITIPLVYLPGGKSDSAMAEYKVNPQVKSTVLVTRHKRVTANFVNVDPSQFNRVTDATHKMLAPSS
jgi:hypothetical protein